ncbi:Uncharacterised protein [uncultured archaeon]|nr:Uncharacterised protein [uncultured archaeon]
MIQRIQEGVKTGQIGPVAVLINLHIELINGPGWIGLVGCRANERPRHNGENRCLDTVASNPGERESNPIIRPYNIIQIEATHLRGLVEGLDLIPFLLGDRKWHKISLDPFQKNGLLSRAAPQYRVSL